MNEKDMVVADAERVRKLELPKKRLLKKHARNKS
jgi:hypothetical protein